MKVHAIVQARMGSRRLPGKVMKEAGGQPLIGHLIDRLRQCDVDRVVVCGPACDQHSTLHKYLQYREVDHFFGEEENDLCARYWSTLALFPCDAFIRVCGDSPLIQPDIVNNIATTLRNGEQFASSVGWKILPPGNSAEGCTVNFYRNVKETCLPEDREHAGFPSVYRKIALHSTLVDTPEDFERVKEMIERA